MYIHLSVAEPTITSFRRKDMTLWFDDECMASEENDVTRSQLECAKLCAQNDPPCSGYDWNKITGECKLFLFIHQGLEDFVPMDNFLITFVRKEEMMDKIC